MSLHLFWSFLKIGAFTFGGGYAMIPLIEREVIDRRRWVERADFLDLLTLAQSAPGPIALNTAVFVGYKVRGLRGAVASLMGIVVPSFLIILLIAILFADIRHNAWVEAAFRGMRPAVVALIIFPVIKLSQGMHRAMYLVIIATAAAIHWLGWSPIGILFAAALLGIAWELSHLKRLKQ
ncbi:MAG: chromate transporter [Alistipes sp.]|nr:chromate transporter [Alistipes sp.]